jgi:hypothetical protein
MSGMTAALSMVHGVAEAEPDEFRVGYVGEDGTQHQLQLADAPAVRFEVMTPALTSPARGSAALTSPARTSTARTSPARSSSAPTSPTRG